MVVKTLTPPVAAVEAFTSAHLAATPFVSCSYWDPAHDVAVAECAARWVEDLPTARPWRLKVAHAATLAAGGEARVWRRA